MELIRSPSFFHLRNVLSLILRRLNVFVSLSPTRLSFSLPKENFTEQAFFSLLASLECRDGIKLLSRRQLGMRLITIFSAYLE